MAEQAKAGFAAPLRVREFRWLWSAELVSIAGDQVARVALSLMVFAQTSSAMLTALTYGLTFVPSVLGGFLLSGLADRFPRRTVIVVADFVRAMLAALMAIPAMPLPALWVCVGLLSVVAGPFKAAHMSLLRRSSNVTVSTRQAWPCGSSRPRPPSWPDSQAAACCSWSSNRI
ncbi:MFS transporter [Amycolatopsis sp. cmx-11-32]|uniref:MFS transporter n=1 Tax=Amycolatopsis sp. cmx-11-32 TaxID=2785796 RepID=UPI0039E38ED1